MDNLETKTTENVENTSAETKVDVQETNKEEKLFTQADLDAAIEKRLAREKKNAERRAKEAEEAAKAKDDSEEIKALKEMIKAKDQRIIKQEAIRAAEAMGVEKDFIEAVVALADFTEINLDNNGGVDTDELNEVLKRIIDKYPRFVATKEDTKKEEPAGFIKAGTPSQTTDFKFDDDALRKAFRLKK